jgi:hypothetical protein
MASEINLDAIASNANGEASKIQFSTSFEPMRRKLQILDA